IFDLLDAVVDERLDVLGGRRTLLRQAAHFAGHDREAAALLAGTRGLDGGVQGEDVGLERDAVDDRDDVDDALGRFGDAGHGLHHVFDHGATVLSGTAGGHGALGGLTGDVGIALHGAGELFHGGGRLREVGGL